MDDLIDFEDLIDYDDIEGHVHDGSDKINKFETYYGEEASTNKVAVGVQSLRDESNEVTEELIDTALNNLWVGDNEQIVLSQLQSYLEHKLIDRIDRGDTTIKPSIADVAKTLGECLLVRRNWNVSSLMEDLFDFNEESSLDRWYYRLYSSNLSSLKFCKPVVDRTSDFFYCNVICDDVPWAETVELPCGHVFSLDAYKGNFRSHARDRTKLLYPVCMDPNCVLPIPYSLLNQCLELEETCRLRRWRRERLMKALGIFTCDAVVGNDSCNILMRGLINEGSLTTEEKKMLLQSDKVEVECPRGHIKCRLCSHESHRPFPCKYIIAWEAKRNDDGANLQWTYANTKKCPQCKENIEKNSGCMHITCRCKYQFCWLCLREWKNHTDYYHPSCSSFQPPPDEAQAAKYELDRYNFYATRQEAHRQSHERLKKIQMRGLEVAIEANRLCVGMDLEADPIRQWKAAIHDYCDLSEEVPAGVIHYAALIVAAMQLSQDPKNQIDREGYICFKLIPLLQESLEIIGFCRRFLATAYIFTYFQNWDPKYESKKVDAIRSTPESKATKRVEYGSDIYDRQGLPTKLYEAELSRNENLYSYQVERLTASLDSLTELVEEACLIRLVRNLCSGDAEQKSEDVLKEEEKLLKEGKNTVSAKALVNLTSYIQTLQTTIGPLEETASALASKCLDDRPLEEFDDSVIDINNFGHHTNS